jgi:hypothetical protein
VVFPAEATIVVGVVGVLGVLGGAVTWGNGTADAVPPVDPPPGDVGMP